MAGVPIDKSGLEILTEAECFALIQTMPIGRVVYSEWALPVIVAVNFALDGMDIVVRSQRRSRLATQAPGNVVAFEVDDIDVATRSGWSVVMTGRFQLVDRPAEIRRLDAIGLHSWAPSAHDRYLKLRPEVVTGRRIPRASTNLTEESEAAGTADAAGDDVAMVPRPRQK
jgi:uncharacterized protein